MDVILDANVILEDPAFERAQFGELFAYLRRTNSRLLIPTIVQDEVEARFRDLLSKQVSIAKNAWEKVKRFSGASDRSLPDISVDRAVQALRARMQSPSPGVLESAFLRSNSVDINDVVQRGIHRRKPASETGEELRDVIVWLIVKNYVKEKSVEIAFISRDIGFRISKDSQDLHPDLRAELVAESLLVSFHVDIAGFITTHALTARLVSELWLSGFLRIVDLRSVATTMLLVKGGAYGIVQHCEVDSLELSKGTEYEVASNSSYVEATYKGTGTLRIVPNTFTMNVGPQNTLTYHATSPLLDQSVSYFVAPEEPVFPSWTGVQNFFGDYHTVAPTQPVVPENRTCIFTLAVSGRIENGTMINGQIDDLQITHMSSLILTD